MAARKRNFFVQWVLDERERNRKNPARAARIHRLADALSIVAASLIAIQIAIHVDWRRLWDFLESAGIAVQLVAAAITFVASFLLFRMRERWPRAYGWIEIGIGVAAVWLAFSSKGANDFERALKVTAGVYLMVRGHDNRVNGYARVTARKAASRDTADEAQNAK